MDWRSALRYPQSCCQKCSKKCNLLYVLFYNSYDEYIADMVYRLGAHYFICKPAGFPNLKKVIAYSLALLSEDPEQPPRDKFVLSNLKSISYNLSWRRYSSILIREHISKTHGIPRTGFLLGARYVPMDTSFTEELYKPCFMEGQDLAAFFSLGSVFDK